MDDPCRCSGPLAGAGSRVHLTSRQVTIIAAVAEGLTSAQIARRIGITPATVEHHLDRAMLLSAARSRSELVARCYASGVLAPEAWPPALSGKLCLMRGVPAQMAG